MNEVTPRDWFAGMALQAIMERGMYADHSYSTLATVAYEAADAMMEKREQQRLTTQEEEELNPRGGVES